MSEPKIEIIEGDQPKQLKLGWTIKEVVEYKILDCKEW